MSEGFATFQLHMAMARYAALGEHWLTASGIEAATAGETAQTGSTVGESPTAKPERPKGNPHVQ